MERLKNMGLKQSFFLLSACCVTVSLLFVLLVFLLCGAANNRFPSGGVEIGSDGIVIPLEQPTPGQQKVLAALSCVQWLACILLPAGGLGVAGVLFYRIKLKGPIAALREGAARIRAHDLDFSIPAGSADELGQLCSAFETMRLELLRTNQALWRQAEERKRLNAAFAHDLRNPITVLKGSVRLLRQDASDRQALDRLEDYTVRIEHYTEAMGSIQRLEQMPVQPSSVIWTVLRLELEETARLFAPALDTAVCGPDAGAVRIDHGIFLTVAENLIGNGARFARGRLRLTLALEDTALSLSVQDDGPGFPPSLLQDGPKPFMRSEGDHFGMGLYSSALLCRKHGGDLRLENRPEGGAAVTASFQISCKS